MKTTGKRRMLISSVAMLLVAMLALGTATFAWFTVDSTTKANNLSVKTSKRSTLEISSNKLDWTSGTLNYAFADQALKPASSADGINWYTATAEKSDSATAAAGTGEKIDMTVDANANPVYKAASENVFYNQLNVRNAGAADVEDVTITFSISETDSSKSQTSNKYLRVAVVPADQAGSAGKVADTTAFLDNNYADGCGIYSVGTDTATPVDHVGANKTATTGNVVAAAKAMASKDGSSTVTVNVGNLTGYKNNTYDVASYMLFVWFEGQDADCSDIHSGNIMPEITFTVEGALVTE